jgi:8-oxo-dGTP diphosphatase
MSEPKPIAVVAAVILQDGRYLLTRRSIGAHLGGLWEFPGGKMEIGESPAVALEREIREELGVVVEVGDLLLTGRHAYPDRTVDLSFYQCRIVSGTPRNLEASEMAWAEPAELARFRFPDANLDLIAKLSGISDS